MLGQNCDVNTERSRYSLCPAGESINEACFHKLPLRFASPQQILRYMYVNNDTDHSNRTEVAITATRVTEGSELQYKCQLVLEFSIENAEIMEIAPEKR